MSYFDVIIPISGGLDSAFAAYNWLKKNQEKKALLLNIKLINGESIHRVAQEQKAVESILHYFVREGLTNYEFKQSTLDYQSSGTVPPVWDIEAVNAVVGIYMRGHRISTYVKGTNADDFKQDGFQERLTNSNQILKRMVWPDLDKIDFIFPNESYSKKEIFERSPKGLVNLTWWCRSPEGDDPCGACDSCKQIA